MAFFKLQGIHFMKITINHLIAAALSCYILTATYFLFCMVDEMSKPQSYKLAQAPFSATTPKAKKFDSSIIVDVSSRQEQTAVPDTNGFIVPLDSKTVQ